MPQVSYQEAGTATLRVRRIGERTFVIYGSQKPLRILRRSSRSRRMLARRHELGVGRGLRFRINREKDGKSHPENDAHPQKNFGRSRHPLLPHLPHIGITQSRGDSCL